MAPSKLRKAIGAVKDTTSIGLAKVGNSASLSDLDVAIVKATRHEELPPDERYILEIIGITTYSRAFVNACVNTISRRLNKTKNWVVALKTLMLVQRLLAEGDVAYEQEIFFATRRGTRLLNMSDFRDTSGKTNAWDYSAFVRTYAMYLDEHLEFKMQGKRGKRIGYGYHGEDDHEGGGQRGRRGGYGYQVEDEEGGGASGATSQAVVVRGTPLQDMRIDRIFSKVHHLMQLLDRFLACRPTGAARDNRVVCVALFPIVRESFKLADDITEILGVLIDRFMQLEIPEMVKVHDIFCRVSKQYDELDSFYSWSKQVGIGRSSEYPDVEKISQKKLDMMDEYIRERASMPARGKSPGPKPESVEEEPEPEPEPDMNEIKALPAPEEVAEETEIKEEEEEEEEPEKVEEEPKKEKKTQDVGDLLNLGADAPTTEQTGDQLALALFDGGPATNAPESTATPWEAFKEHSSGDWELALVQSSSHLSNQKASLPGGFDTLILDGMYQHGAATHTVAASGVVTTGSASSVALGSAGRPAMLALPAPPAADGAAAASSANSDPFAASLSVAPPAYVQMSEMEKKQRLLVEEQVMWQQYARDGRQGQVAFTKVQQNPFNTGGYTRTS